jgi:hypothetical protein
MSFLSASGGLLSRSVSAAPCQSYQLKMVDDFLVSLTNGALQNDPVDEDGWFSQMLASRKTTAEYTKLTKTLRLQRNLRLKTVLICG